MPERRDITIGRGSALVLAGSVVVAGIAVAGGAFLGGYALGHTPASPPPTELAEKTYTIADLEAALTACEIEGEGAETASVTIVGADHSPMKRQCFVAEMGATELAVAEYGFSSWGTPEGDYLEGGEYSWSNVTMVWEQTELGRDVTITVTD